MWFQNFKRSFIYKLTVAFLLSLTVLTTVLPVTTPVHAQLNNQLQGDEFFTQFKPVCGLDVLNGGSLVGCIAQLIYFIFYKIPAVFAGLMGKIMDFFIGYSIDSNSYTGGDTEYSIGNAIQNAWVAVRNIANIFFILILIYAAIATIFNISGVNYKSIVPAIIINALLINFSLFITKAMIDVSNIAAHVFYNQIVVENPETKTTRTGIGGYTSISEGIVAGYQPQRILAGALSYTQDPNKLYAWMKTLQADLKSDLPAEEKALRYKELREALVKERRVITDIYLLPPIAEFITMTDDQLRVEANRIIGKYGSAIVEHVTGDTSYAGTFILISILAGVISFFTGLMFFRISFVFLGRVIGFYIGMIFSPFAFMSRKVPFLGTIDRLGWEGWVKGMFSNMIVAPLFIFFIFIIYRLLTSDFYQNNFILPTSGFVGTLIAVSIPMLIIYGLMSAAQKATLKYGNEFSDTIYDWGKKIAGLGIGVASGGVALAGTRGLAWAGRAVQKSKLGGSIEATKATSRNWFARNIAAGASSALVWTQKSTWDPRNVKPIQETMKKMGVDTKFADKTLSYVGMGTKDFKGGFEGRVKAKKESRKKEYESIKTNLSKEDALALWNKQLEKEAEKKFIQQLKKERKWSTSEAKTYKNTMALASGKNLSSFVADTKKEADTKYGKVKDNKTYNKALKRKYEERIKEGSTAIGTATETTLGTIAGGFVGDKMGGVGATVTGGVIGGALAYEQTMLRKVADKEFLDEIKKSRSKEEHAEEHLQKIQDLIADLLEVEYKKFEEMDYNKQEDLVRKRRYEMEAELEKKEAEAKKAKEAHIANPTNSTLEKAYKEAFVAQHELKDSIDRLKKIFEEKEKAEERLEKIKEGKEKNKKEGKEKKEEDKEKEKEKEK